MFRHVLISLLTFVCIGLSAQELDCKVSINHSQVQGTNAQVFTTLESSLTEFLNGRRWTSALYDVGERIRCSFSLIVKSYSEEDGRWSCDLIVQSVRPVYNSSYQSVLFSFKDSDVDFDYHEYDRLEFRDNVIDNNLVAVAAYYVYMIIGMDMDSMSSLGGTDMFRQAETIVNVSQGLNEKGWKAFDDSRNRYALVSDYLDGGMTPLRQLLYNYHRKGLDEMAVNASIGRAELTSALAALKEAHVNKPMSALPVLFTEVKRDELVDIYGGASPSSGKERSEVYKLLSDINPSLNAEWEKIKSR